MSTAIIILIQERAGTKTSSNLPEITQPAKVAELGSELEQTGSSLSLNCGGIYLQSQRQGQIMQELDHLVKKQVSPNASPRAHTFPGLEAQSTILPLGLAK